MPVLPLQVRVRPTTTPARFGLLDTITPQPLPLHGGMAGLTYDTDFCGVARPWEALPCVDPGVAEKVGDDGIGSAVGSPIQVYHLHTCRLVGSGTEQERQSRAERAIELGASRALEEGFGDVIGADPNVNDVTPGGTPVGVIEGLALLEQYGGANYGGQRYIHADNAVVTVLISQGLVFVVGDHLETILGSIVISGPGYADSTGPSAPAAGAHWMFATGQVNIWAEKIKVTETILNSPYDNEYNVLAERVYVPTYECFAAAVEVNLEA